MNLMTRALLLPFIILMGTACSPEKQQDTSGVREEMKNRELVRVTNVEIMTKGNELGIEIVKAAQNTLQQALLKAIETDGLVGAIEYCNANAYDIVNGIEDSLSVEIRRVSRRPRNPLDAPDDIERAILEAYAYDFSPTNAVNQVQELDDRTLIFTQPIAIGNGMCLNCHGEPKEQIKEDVLAAIKSKYPNDVATGYSLGQLRGMWSVKIPKKTVVNQLAN